MPTIASRLTDTFLRGAAPATYRDTQETALVCRVSATGRKVWSLSAHVRGRHVKRRLGLFQAAPGGPAAPVKIGTGAARDLARLTMGRLVAGDGGQPAAPVAIPTLAEWFDDHEARSKNEAETLRYHRYRFETYVRRFRVQVGGLTMELGGVPIDRIEGYHLDDLRDSITARRRAAGGDPRVPPEAAGARTANLVLARLNTLLIDAERRQRLPAGWTRPRPTETAAEAGASETNHIRLAQAGAFYAAVAALRTRPGYKFREGATIADVILTCLWTGGRIGNVAAMRWEDLDLEGAVWRIPRAQYKTRRRMTGSHKVIPLPPPAADLLRRRQPAAAGPWVFPRAATPDEHIRDIGRSLKWVLATAGITQRVTVHGLRHTLGTWLHEAGAPLKTIAAQLGQADLASTERYAHDEIARVRELAGNVITASYRVVDSCPADQVEVRLTREQWEAVLAAMDGQPVAAVVARALGARGPLQLPAGAGVGQVVGSTQ